VKTLYSIQHSPWSERARWALLHHAIDFREQTHVPLIGEIPLRFKAKKWSGKISVPLFLDEAGAAQGSLAIAERADQIGKNTILVPQEKRAEIAVFFEEIEQAMNAARERFSRSLSKHPDAVKENAPGFLRAIGMAGPAVRLGTWFIVRKYEANDGAVDERIRKGLMHVREAIGAKSYVSDAFSFADIVGASIVQAIAPFDEKFLSIPPATRKLWRHEAMAAEFSDLIAWRDAVYEKHRPLQR